jgi:hypothetical protein
MPQASLVPPTPHATYFGHGPMPSDSRAGATSNGSRSVTPLTTSVIGSGHDRWKTSTENQVQGQKAILHGATARGREKYYLNLGRPIINNGAERKQGKQRWTPQDPKAMSVRPRFGLKLANIGGTPYNQIIEMKRRFDRVWRHRLDRYTSRSSKARGWHDKGDGNNDTRPVLAPGQKCGAWPAHVFRISS